MTDFGHPSSQPTPERAAAGRPMASLAADLAASRLPQTDWSAPMRSIAQRAREACRAVAALSPEHRRSALLAMADGLEEAEGTILAANAADMDSGRRAGLSPAMLDRLHLTAARLAGVAAAVRAIAGQPECLGQILEEHTHPDGLHIQRLRVPLGVVAMIYESRPNVTADAAALCFKSGNAAILRGGSEALRSNRALLKAMLDGAGELLPEDAIQLLDTTDRAAIPALLANDDCIDLVIPRGGEALVNAVCAATRIPVLKHAKGVCHVYVDKAADLDMAAAIVENAKCQRPGVCNAMETLLVHREVAEAFVPMASRRLLQRGVELRCDAGALPLCRAEDPASARVLQATESDWSTEYLDLILSIAVVDDLDAAINHIERFGSRHSDAIVTEDERAARRFLHEVDSAAVYWNASTRFTDGAEFGLGAEIGISTDKLHARGPCGARELTTSKWVVRGVGQVRR